MAERPTVLILVDERCGICTRAGARLARRRGVAVEQIGSPTGTRLLRDLVPAERYATVHAVDASGRRRSGGAAVATVLALLPGGRGPASVARRFPRLTDAAYRFVARNRGRLSRVAGLHCSGLSPTGVAAAPTTRGRPWRDGRRERCERRADPSVDGPSQRRHAPGTDTSRARR